MDCKMITDLETKYGVQIKHVYLQDAPPNGRIYGVYKKGFGLYTFISYIAEEKNYAKSILEYTIKCLQSKINEFDRCKLIGATA